MAVLVALPFAQVGYAADTAATGNVEEIVVTGSYIKGSAENAALPVDVVTAQDTAGSGQPDHDRIHQATRYYVGEPR